MKNQDLVTNVSTGKRQAEKKKKGQWNSILKILKENNLELRILYPVNCFQI